ncbi:MAG: hypothetical protein NTZ44_04225 [Candidatus Nomurabacteria bacterium]|nr:hypothetical protein [Candidatus Nomurabacteria bacterium]
MNSETRNCQKCKNNFNIEPDGFSFYEKLKVPAPKVCPDCRFKQQAVWRNEMSLYTGRACDLCKKSIVTMYNPKSSYKVYCLDCYKSDNWDPRSFAKAYDSSRSFFEQLNELLISVPKATLFDAAGYGSNVRSDYTNASAALKDCYFLFNSGPAENTFYSRGVDMTNDVSDAYFCVKDEQCYEILNTHECNTVVWSTNCRSCVNCYFCEDLSGCTDCFGCVGLRNKSLHIYNEKVSRDEFGKFMDDFRGSYKRQQEEKQKFNNFRLQFPKRESHNIGTVNSSGDYLSNTKNVKHSFEIRVGGEDAMHCFACKAPKDSVGVLGYGVKSELLLEVVSTGNSSRVIGSYAIDNSSDVLHSFSCRPNNKKLIGCDSMKNAEYCILNKQYTKEEYEKLREHIINELTEKGVYGLMMPPELSPFAYNETIAQDNMPLSKEEAIAQGFRWEDDVQMTKGKETLLPENIPDHIKDIADDITKEILKCVDCERNYKIIEQELLFYKKMTLPIPRKCFYCRHKDRIVRRGPYKFWQRNCAHCNKEITTNYAPERPEIVYCEECYQQEIY